MEEVTEQVETVETEETTQPTDTEQVENTENTEPSTETTEKTFTQAELDEIIQKRVERAEQTTAKKTAQEARDAYIAEQGYEWNGKKIANEAEYNQAVKEQELVKQYKDKDLPDDVIQELVEGKKFRDNYTETQKQLDDRVQRETDYQTFLESYPDAKPDDIPESVWQEVDKGTPLVDAYTRHENQRLKAELDELKGKQEIEQKNQENAESTTGSVTGKGETKGVYYTMEQVQKMSPSDVNKNYKAILDSQKHWYK